MQKNLNLRLTQNSDRQELVQRLIVIWALSEAALGGVLHALKIPLTGIFINGTAVIIIALIAYYGPKKGMILKATFIVLIVKAAVSPHTPLNAYLALSVQGLVGAIIFSTTSFFKAKCVLLGVFTLFLSGVQRIVVVTILYGANLWESIDIFGNYVLQQIPFFINGSESFEVSYWLIGSYVGIHILFGILIGIFAGKIPAHLDTYKQKQNIPVINNDALDMINNKKNKKKFWLKKPSGLAILFLVAIILIFTYIYPKFSESVALKAIIMVFRSIFIMLIWYLFAGPFLLKIYKNYISKYSYKYSSDVDFTIEILPLAKSVVIHQWNSSKQYKPIKRIPFFILTTIANMLLLELPVNEKNLPVNRSKK